MRLFLLQGCGVSTMNQQIGVCSWSLRPRSPQALLDSLRQADMDAVQLALSPIVHDPAAWGDAIEELRRANIAILSGMMAMIGEDYSTLESIRRTGGVRPDSTWPGNLQHARDVARLAARAGINLVTFHAGFLPEDQTSHERTIMLDRLAVVADVFGESDIDVALETGQERAATLLAALDDLAQSNVGVNFDPANMILYGQGDPVEALRMLAPHVRQIHVKDAMPAEEPGKWGREVAAGRGAVDWPAFFTVASQIVPPVNFVIEREARDERLDDVVAARDMIRRHAWAIGGQSA
jgi:sugar phosphate isomerase/epimerase